MRAVLDSNVLARALYSAGGPPAECVERLGRPPHVLVVSEFLLDEVSRVLRYPRLRSVHGFDEAVIQHCRQHGITVMDDVELATLLRKTA